MNYRIKKILIVLAFLLFLSPKIVNAEGIKKYLINSTIEQNGDLEVEEYFYMDGYFNGFDRYINYRKSELPDFNSILNSFGGSKIHNGDSIILESIAALDINPNFAFDNITTESFKEVYTSQDSGTSNVYMKSDTIDGIKLRIYLPSSKNKAFYIKYKITNIAIMHNDVGELGWNLLGKELSEHIDFLKAYINIPNNTSNIRAWSHGPLNGKVNILSNNRIEVTVDNLNSYTAIDIRTTFDKNVIFNSTKQTNVNALDKILVYEQIEADKANEERDKINENIKENALSAILALESNPSRSNYNYAIEKANLIGDEQLKNNYLNRIKLQEDNVEKYQVKIAEDYIAEAIKNKEYESYKSAVESMNYVYKQENINFLKEKLNEAKKSIIKKESKSEILIIIIHLGTIGLMFIIYKMQYIDISMIDNENTKYLRNFPSNIHPSSLGLLYNKRGTPNLITANLLLLIDSGVIKYEKVEEDNYLFTIIEEKNINLSEIDQAFVDLFFNKNRKMTSKEFEKICKKQTLKTKFIYYVGKLKSDLLKNNLINIDKDEEQKTLNFDLILITIISSLFSFKIMLISIPLLFLYLLIKNGIKANTFSILLFIITIIISIKSIYITVTHNNFIYYSICINIICFIINIILMRKTFIQMIKRTKEGNIENSKWCKFKSFIEDFSTFDEKELPEIILWDKYLIYATSLGCAEKLSKIMSQKVSQLSITDNSLILISNIDDLIIFNNTLDSSTFSNNYLYRRKSSFTLDSPLLRAAASSSSSESSWSSSSDYSSGSGGGGGFSGGSSSGGGFGGGGGGGRF